MARRSKKTNEIISLASYVTDEEYFIDNYSAEDFEEDVKRARNEAQVIELARRVLTEAGARYFGLPIGSLISPDKEDDAKARHGGRAAPPGAATGSNQRRAGSEKKDEDPAAKIKINDEPPTGASSGGRRSVGKTPDGETPLSGWADKKFIKSTLTGTQKVEAGKASYQVPEGSDVYQSPKHRGRIYVITPDGETHVFTSAGELDITPQERQALTAEVRNSFSKKDASEEDTQDVTWVRLVSIARQIAQAEAVGDDSLVEKLEEEFRTALASYAPEEDPRAVRSEITRGSTKD